MRAIHRLLLFLCVVLWLYGISAGQSVRGVLAGTVMDSSGAAIAGASVQAKNHDTGVVSTTASTSVGVYRFVELPLGTYDITASAPGFKNAVLTGVQVQIQNVTALDITLQVGQRTESVVVDAGAPHVEAESSDLGGVVSARQVIELPLPLGGVGALRAVEAFEFLLPGTTGPGTGNSNNGIFISKIAGGQNFANEVLIDGASQTRSENGSSFDEEAPSVEALQEFKITTALAPAEYGRTTGGIENFVTKSGTNTFHGTAYEIFRNEDLDANTWFNSFNGSQCAVGDAGCLAANARPADKKNDYGGTLGGPVWIPKVYNGRDRTFFFFSWEQLGYKLGATNTTTVPTDAMRGGDFSSLAIYRTDLSSIGTNPCDGTPVFQGEIFDPSTTKMVNGVPCRTQFPGNKIDPTFFSTVAKNLLPFWPEPTNKTAQFNNFTLPSTIPINNTATTIRIDHSFSEESKIFGSYNSRENNRTSGGNPILPDPVDPNTWKQDFTTHFFRLGWDYIFSPTLLNHLAFGSNRSNSKNFAQAIFAGVNWSQQVGIGNVNSLNFPQITIGEQIDNLGNPPQNDDNVDNGLRLYESVAWEHGRHSMKFGFDYRWQQYSPINSNSPTFNFCRAQTTSDPTETALGGNGFASFLLGDPCGAGQNVVTSQPRWTSRYVGGFVQDDFKVTRGLTLNLGLRYDVDAPRHEAHNQTSNFSLTAIDPEFGIPGAMVFGSQCDNCNTAWADTWWKDISPRIGFAYSPARAGKTVIRGGFSIFYGPLQYADFGGSMNTGYRANPSNPSPDGFSPSFQLDSGFPAFTPPPNLDPGIFNGTFVGGSYTGRDQGRPAMVSEWTLQVQRELANDLILTVGYLGNHAQNLRSGVQNINNIPASDFSLGDQLTQPVANNTAGVTAPFPGFATLWGPGGQVQQALRPFPQYGFIATDCCLQNVGMSSYEALLVSVNRRFRDGLNLQASYTWSKTLTDADSALPGINGGVGQEQNPSNLHQEKALSSQDIPRTLVLSWIYQLPFGQGRKWLNNGFAGRVLGGWDLGAVQRYMSGEPISFRCASGIPGWDNCIYFTRVAGQSFKSAAYASGSLNLANGDVMFNRGAFTDLNLESIRNGAPFTFGNIPRVTGEVRNWPYYNEDFSVTKNVPIRERLSLSLRFELLNVFNRHVFGIPDTQPNDGSNFGRPTFTIDTPRNVQIFGRLTF